MPLRKPIVWLLISATCLWSFDLPIFAYQQGSLATPDQLDQLLAPIALYPDQLVAQICTASTDPQQILDADSWIHQNQGLTGQARSDAAQQQGFDPAFLALVNFPHVLDMMAQNIDDYAAIGQAFAADQGTVMDSVQRLRQQAYASGALESNQYQTVNVQPGSASQIIVIQPATPQVVYVPQYDPQVVYVQPGAGVVIGAPFLTFGTGITLEAWISNSSYPWGWGGWGWNWGRRSVLMHNSSWVVGNNRYRPRYPSYRYRPPRYGRPVYVRPPNNWHDRPYYRPPSGRPPVNRPPAMGNRPPSRPNPGRPPATGPGNTRPPGGGGGRPGAGTGNRPSTNRPPNQRPPASGARPTPPFRPGSRPGTQYKPNPNAGYGGPRSGSNSGGRTSVFGGGNNAVSDRTAINRGRASVSHEKPKPRGTPK